MSRKNTDASSFRGIPLSEVPPLDGETYVFDVASGEFIPAAGGSGGSVSSLSAKFTETVISEESGFIGGTATRVGDVLILNLPHAKGDLKGSLAIFDDTGSMVLNSNNILSVDATNNLLVVELSLVGVTIASPWSIYYGLVVTSSAGGSITVTSAIDLGGINEGQTYTDQTPQEMWSNLVEVELFPTLTNPSSTFTENASTYYEIGDIINVTFSSTFNRGAINPQYTAASPYRSGLPNAYNYSGTDLPATVPSTSLSDSQVISNYTVVSGSQSWTGNVSYDAGVQPKSSKDNDYNSPLPAGNTSNTTRSLTGVYPAYATTSSLTVSKQSLQNMNSIITVSMVAEDGVSKQAIEFPTGWKTITSAEQYNTLSGQWDTIPLSGFTQSTTTQTIQGNVINYTRYEHNGATIGARQLRFN